MPEMAPPRARASAFAAPSPVPPPSEPSDAPTDPRRWLALAVILTAAFLGVLDFSIVNVAIPSIKAGLNARDGQVQFMIAGYSLAYAVLLITAGRLGDVHGRKRIFIWGVAGFTLASVLCGLALDPVSLIAARLLQGLAGALMFPQVLSLIQVTFPPAERPMAFGIFGAVLGTGSFAGNLLGGWLVEADLFGLGWRPIFLVNLPVGTLAVLAAVRLLRESRSERAHRLDLGGVALATVTLLLLLFPIIEGREFDWPWWAFACLAATGPLFVLFVGYEKRVTRRGGAPLVELSLFRNRSFTAGLLTVLAYYGALGAFVLAVTMFLQRGLGFSPHQAGLTFAPMAVGFFAASTTAVRLTPWLGSRIIHLGSALMTVGLAWVIVLAAARGTAATALELVPALTVYGIGQGFVSPTLVRVVLSGIPSHAVGSASGVLTTLQQVASAFGVAALGSVYFGILGPAPVAAQYPAAVVIALTGNLVLQVATFALAFRLPRRGG